MLATTLHILAIFSITTAGSVEFAADVAPLLENRPALQRQIDGLEFPVLGTGRRIDFDACPALVGSRVGPYHFLAWDTRAEAWVEVTFLTQVEFFDAEGRLIGEGEDLYAAVKLREEVLEVRFGPEG